MTEENTDDRDERESDRPTIHALDQTTVQRIAAGEVVERPASVVKELVENSLDADADRVAVSVWNGGKEGVRVRDDGVGMTEDELAIAVEEHTTSKISGIDDLETGVGTLGFRGEALHTISAVSRTTVRSKRRGSTGAGAELTVEGGDVGEVRPAGCPTGTTIEVEDLFFNTPARKKFLKTDATEFDHVNTVVTQYALANPDVAVALEHDGREVFATEGNGDLRSAVLAVYGREVAESMIELSVTAADGPVERVYGLVSHPETTRSSRDYLATFVNDRYVTASALREAVVNAYGGQLAPDRYPFAALFVDVPADTVDVNVHPRKMEVRFDAESDVKATVSEAVEAALVDHGLIRSTAPRGRSAPDETDVTPEAPDDEVVGGAGTTHEEASGVAERRTRRDRSPTEVDVDDCEGASAASGDPDIEGDQNTDDESPATVDPKPRNDDSPVDREAEKNVTPATDVDPDSEDAWVVTDAAGGDADATDSVETHSDIGPSLDDAGSGGDVLGHVEAHTDVDRPSPREWQREVGSGKGGDDGKSGTGDEGGKGGDGGIAGGRDGGDGKRDGVDEYSGVRAPTNQRTLTGEETTAERAFDSLPSLRVLGQLHDTYVVAEAPDGLVLIDQHAADERVNYERLQREFADGMSAQALAEPVELELTAREAALFVEYTEALAELGFRAERADERTVAVSAVPAVFDATLDPELLRDVVTAFVRDDEDGTAAVADVADELLADLACYPSVTGNTSLTEGSVVDLLETLDGCENPYACSHGRPVLIAFDSENIEDRFERDYPGHSGRRAE